MNLSRDDRAPASLPTRLLGGAGPFWLIGAVCMVLLVGLWGGIRHQVGQDLRLAEDSIRRDTRNLARAFEEHTVRTLASADQTVLFLKYQYEKIGEKVDIADYLQVGMVSSNLLNQLGVIDEHGIYALSSLPNHKPLDLSDREHFRFHVAQDTGRLFVSKPVLGRASGKWSLQLTRRINKPDGRFDGVVVSSVDPFYFTTFYSEVALGRDGVVTLLGQDGVTRARRAGGKNDFGQDVSGSGSFARLTTEESGFYRDESILDGVSRYYSFRRLKDYPLVVVVGVGEAEALAGYRARKEGYLAFGGAMTMVTLGFAALAVYLLHRQRQVSVRLRASQAQAESANRLKSEFLASMSHELRTPINGIMGYAEYIRDASSDALLGQFADVIHGSSKQLLRLVNSILDLAKIEAGRMSLDPAAVLLGALIQEVYEAYRGAADAKGLLLECELVGELPEFVYCDRLRVRQVLENLMENAIKFTDQGFVRLRAWQEGSNLWIGVRDSGPGIPGAMQGVIFERFQQLEAFETRSREGAGLGLALSSELVALMGGSMVLESAPGQGSEFRVSLPALMEMDGRQ
ncbi:MAG: ATP-binding protein [Rhodocyclaceae bacterium]|jgi:signal transduction histidine kinase|nr:ATP-binding protein [Rhodocyclaceae bacterium]